MARLKTHKMFVTRVTVTGSRRFPIDMLRYDRACPASETDSNLIARTFEKTIRVPATDISVVMHKPISVGPTVARWESFGWRVKSIEAIED